MAPRAFITGLSGPAITADERAFLHATTPWGLILFKRNVQTPAQIASLVDEFRKIVGRSDAPVLIDQEGGRVQRLGPPQWPAYPPGAAYGRLYDRDSALGLAAAKLGGRLIAAFADVAANAGASGMHIITDKAARNVRFYTRCGFAELGATFWNGREVVFLGMPLRRPGS